MAALLATASPCRSSEGTWLERRDDRCILRYHRADSALAGALLGELASAWDEVAEKLGVSAGPAAKLCLASSASEFRRLTSGQLPHWSAACALPHADLIILRRSPGEDRELLRTARHEMAHILVHRAAPGEVPLWFDEGVAMWAAGEWRLSQSAEVFLAVLGGGLLSLGEIEGILRLPAGRARLAYTQSFLVATYLIHLGGPGAVAAMMDEMSAGASFDLALYRLTGMTPGEFEEACTAYVRGRYRLGAIFLAPEMIWIHLCLLFLAVYVAVRIRNRKTLRRWADQDATEDLPLKLRLQIHRRGNPP